MLKKRCIQPPLGLLTLAATLPANWKLTLADTTARPVSESEWNNNDVIMITGMFNQYSGIIDAVQEGKKRGKLVVVGGPVVFHVPEQVLAAGADIVVRGEAEVTVDRLVEAIQRRESGIIIQTNERADLKKSPPPRYDLLELKHYVDMSIQASRGCPFQCEFCDITLMFGRQVRTKSPDQILTELQILYDLGWRRLVFFVDDNFIGNPPEAKKLMNELVPWMEAHGFPFEFTTQASVNLASHPDILDLMVRAGFWKVFLGIETPDKDSLKETKKFQNAAVDLDRVCDTITKAGLQIIAGCILGFDNEPKNADRLFIDFARRNKIPEMFITLLQVGPGTELWCRLEKEGRLLFGELDDNLGSQTGLINFMPTRPRKEIAEEFIRLYDELYAPEFYMKRTFENMSFMNPLPKRTSNPRPYWNEIRAVLITFFRQGIIAPSRFTFWKYLTKMLLHHPDKTRRFVSALVVAEHYYEYRRTIKTELESQLMEVAGCEAYFTADSLIRTQPHSGN
jgi:radical SAM superfamily enzyme YgiQ (UPF0313 family)